MIRSVELSDLEEIKRIHSQYFADEFDLPDFFNYLCAFVVEDEKGIITIGGVRDIAESVIVTDKSRTPQDRIKALYKIFDALIFTAEKSGYDQLYAFSQNKNWSKRMQRNGFRLPQGQALILDL